MFYSNSLACFIIFFLLQAGTVEQKKQRRSSKAKFAFGGALYVPVDKKAGNESLFVAVERVLYTHDGKTPFELQVLDPDTGQPRLGSLVWGMRYDFVLSYPSNNHNISTTSTPSALHSFVIFQYWDEQFYMLQHTYTNDTELSLELPGVRSSNTVGLSVGVTQHAGTVLESSSADTRNLPDLNEFGGKMHMDSVSDSTKQEKNEGLEEENFCGGKASSRCYFVGVENCQCFCEIRQIDFKLCRNINLKSTFIDLIKKSCDMTDTNEFKSHLQNKEKDSIAYSRIHQQTFQEDIPVSLHTMTSKNSTVRLKILTFNIWNVNVVSGGEAEYKKRIHHLAALCRTADADIIGLQEVRFQEGKCGKLGPNQMKHLSDMLPEYQFIFQPGQVQKTELPNLVMEGVAFMSRHPITAHHSVFLKQDLRDPADGHQRVLLYAEVQLPLVGKVHVLNTHLSLSHKARATSMLQAWTYVKTLSGPAFLMGDFNAEAHNIEVQFLDGRAELRGSRTTGFHDVWRLKHGPNDPGFTFNPCKELSKRIDLIFMRDDELVSLSDVWILDDKTRGAEAASDHLGLVAEFAIRGT